MSNISHNVFQSMYFDNNDDEQSYLTVKSVSFNNDTFSFDIWFYIEGKSSEIISQTNGLLMGVEDETLFLTHKDIGKIYVGDGNFKPKVWTNVFVSYDKQKLRIALNGIDIDAIDVDNKKLLSSGDIKVGAGFSGNMRYVRFYKNAIEPKDYSKYLYVNVYTQDMTNLAGFIDLCQLHIKDLSPNNLQIKITNSCYVVNCMHVFNPTNNNQSGYAMLDNSPEINPGYNGGVFSIYAKVYPKYMLKQTQAILSNGYIDKNDSLAICMEFENKNSPKIKIKLGNNWIPFDLSVQVNQWVDILVVYDGAKISIYADGLLAGEQAVTPYSRSDLGEVKIGNAYNSQAKKEYYGFEGYISTVAIFNKVLGLADASAFCENQPFIFEDGLEAIYSFDKGIAAELVNSRELTLTNNSGLLIAQRTTDELCENPYQFRVTKTYQPLSKMNEWRVSVISEAIFSYFKNCFGLEFQFKTETNNAMPEYFKHYIYNRFRYRPEFEALYAQELLPDSDNTNLDSKDNLTSSSGSQLIRRAVHTMNDIEMENLVVAGRVNAPVNVAAGGGAAAGGGVAAATTPVAMESSAFAFSIAVASLAATKILTETLKLIEDERNKRPLYPDDEDDPNKEYRIEILEMSFQSYPDDYTKSAVHCQNGNGVVNPPEWKKYRTQGEQNEYAIYIASEIATVNIKVKFKFHVTTQFPKPTYSVTINGYTKDNTKTLFNHLSATMQAVVGENDIELTTSEIIGKRMDDLYKYNSLFNWNYQVDTDIDVHPDITLNYFTLPNIPVPPIYLDKKVPDQYIFLELLDVLSKVPVEESKEAFVSGFSKSPSQITRELYHNPRLRYDSTEVEAAYLQRQTVRNFPYIYFFLKSFINDKLRGATGVTNIDCCAYACLLNYYFKLFAITGCNVVLIANIDLAANWTSRNKLPLKPNLLPAPGAGTAAPTGSFTYHAVVSSPIPGNYNIYDACFTTGGIYFDGIVYKQILADPAIRPEDNGSYLDFMFQIGTNCKIIPVMVVEM
jgi:hypothetical protein